MKKVLVLLFMSLIFISIFINISPAKEGSENRGNSNSDSRSDNDNRAEDNIKSNSVRNSANNVREKIDGGGENTVTIQDKEEKRSKEIKEAVGKRIKKGEEIFRARIKEKIENEEERKEIIKGFRKVLKEKEGELMIDERRIIKVKELDDEGKKKEISVGKIRIKTNLDLASEMDEQTKGERLRAILSNGKVANVKIMPDRASLIALKKLKAKCEEVNCNIELKEVREGDKLKLKYKIATKKDGRLLFLFKLKMDVNSEIDAETGEVVAKKPWWAFLVDEDDATDEEIKENVEGDEIDENVDVEGDIAPNTELDAKISELVSSIQGIENNIRLILDVAKRNDKTDIRADIEGQLTDEQKKIWEEIQNLTKLLVENVERDIKLKIVIKNNVGEKDKETEREKVVICHIPRGETSAAKTIKVGAAVKAHLAHGDKLGECSSVGGGGGGEEIIGNETNRCELEPKSGSCKARFTRYYFDQEEKICKSFTWGGCEDGIVPFDSLEKCHKVCEEIIPKIPKNETEGNETIPGNETIVNATLPPEQNTTNNLTNATTP